ncbi:MAG: DUF2110 family protein [Candidatus Bathyarchaeia archaeon]
MNGRLVIAERIPHHAQNELMPVFKSKIDKLSSGLDVSVKLGVSANSFVNGEVQGSDSEFFIELIKRKMGLAPQNLSDVKVHDNFKAFVSGINAKRQSIEVEIGPVSTNVKSEITREALIAQLCDGKAIPVDRVAQTYCVHEGTPILVRITSINPERRQIEAWISDDQVARFEQWRRERTHRIIAVGGSHDRLREAMRLSKADRDIIQIEELSFTANSLVCKLGTDAPGIIARIGRFVSEFRLYAFLPEKVDKLRTGVAGKQ